MTPRIRPLMDDYDSGDPYGWAMSWLFAICDHITFETELYVPTEWGFRPSMMGKSTDDTWQIEILSTFPEEDLIYAGEVLHRYIEKLKKAGKDY